MRLDTTNQDHYDIMTALRGPDGDGYFMSRCKVLFTMRIRYWVGCMNSSAGLIRGTKTTEDVIQEVLDSAPDGAPDWWLHYCGHVRYALKSLLRMSSRSLRDFSPSEAEQLLVALDKISAAFYPPVEDEELPF